MWSVEGARGRGRERGARQSVSCRTHLEALVEEAIVLRDELVELARGAELLQQHVPVGLEHLVRVRVGVGVGVRVRSSTCQLGSSTSNIM